MLTLAFTTMATVKGEWHGKNYILLGPHWPTVKPQIRQI